MRIEAVLLPHFQKALERKIDRKARFLIQAAECWSERALNARYSQSRPDVDPRASKALYALSVVPIGCFVHPVCFPHHPRSASRHPGFAQLQAGHGSDYEQKGFVGFAQGFQIHTR